MTVISECVCLQVVFVSGIPHNSRRDWSIYFDFVALPINYTSFVDVVGLFSFHCETTTKAKFTFYAKDNGS